MQKLTIRLDITPQDKEIIHRSLMQLGIDLREELIDTLLLRDSRLAGNVHYWGAKHESVQLDLPDSFLKNVLGLAFRWPRGGDRIDVSTMELQMIGEACAREDIPYLPNTLGRENV